jgi:predicted DNA-binding transcriptional regulator AlpA
MQVDPSTTNTLDPGDRLLTDPEGAARLNVGVTQFRLMQKDADFPPPIWFGPRMKRHSERRLLGYAARKAARTAPGTAEARRIADARKASRCEAPAQQGSATVAALLLLTVAAGAALAMLGLVDAHALAMAGPLLGMGAVARATDPDQGAGESPEYVGHSLDGERIAKRGQHAARDGYAAPDRFLHDLLDLLAADGIRLAPTARLRAWCRTHQKALEQRA